jgi:hypothetical protein
MRFSTLAAGAVTLAMSFGVGATAHAALIGPVMPYFGFSDSPFFGKSFSYFQLDTFEGGAITPGFTASAGGPIPPGPLVDSVDGGGSGGWSWFSGCGACGVTFTFDAGVLGKLPTSVGIVWTDGDGPNRTFEAFDEHGASLGTIIDSTQKFFSTGGDDDPANYRFFGVTNPGGISSIFIANDGGGIEVDHLQYGANVPEPAAWAMMLIGLGGLGAMARARRMRPA